jgi:hypothetical protein
MSGKVPEINLVFDEPVQIRRSNSDEAVTGWKSFRTHDRFVQAIRGFLLGFRRSDSVASKTRAVGKLMCAMLVLENPNKLVCDK